MLENWKSWKKISMLLQSQRTMSTPEVFKLSFPCLPQSLLGGSTGRVMGGFQLLFQLKECSSAMAKHEIIAIGPKGTHGEMDKRD